ncbi:MAG: streptogrisin [bacterium]
MNAASMRVLVVAGATAMSFGSVTASAVAADAGASPFEAAVAAYKSAYPQISDARARANAAGADARRTVYDAAAADAATFGGAWFDPLTGAVNVAGTTAAANSRVVALGKQYGVAVQPVKVKRTAAALEAEAARLRGGKDELGRSAKGQVGIDVTTNTVTVAVPRERKAALASSAAASGAKLVEDPGTKIEADAGCTTRSACDWTIRAGAIMWRGTTTSNTPWCSVGFTARNVSNTRFVYTAGHCNTGINVNWGTGGQNIGPLTAAMDSGAVDASVIQVTNSWFTGDTGGEIYISPTSTASVVGVAPSVSWMVAGETVCLSANFTQPDVSGNSCGILGTNSDAAVRGLARVDGLDGCGGDSGGGWYWLSSSGNRYAYGIHSRSDTGCHGDAGGTHSWYTAIATAKSSFQPTLNVETRP